MARSGPWMLFSGMVATAAGLAIVLGHNMWSGGALAVVVTLSGWAALLKGVSLLLVPPEQMAAAYKGLGFEQFFNTWIGGVLALDLLITLEASACKQAPKIDPAEGKPTERLRRRSASGPRASPQSRPLTAQERRKRLADAASAFENRQVGRRRPQWRKPATATNPGRRPLSAHRRRSRSSAKFRISPARIAESPGPTVSAPPARSCPPTSPGRRSVSEARGGEKCF